MLIVGAIADTQDRKYRYAVAVFGVVGFAGTFWTLHGNQFSILQLSYFATGLCAIVIVSQRTFSFWSDTLVELASAKQREIQTTVELNRSRMEAMIGHQSRAIAHEINNIVGVMTLAIGHETIKSEKILTSAAERLRKLCSTMTKAGKQSSTKVTTSVTTIVDEVRTLLIPFVKFQSAELDIVAEPNTNENGQEFLFEESEGSTYLILHNLVKNAVEAGVGLHRYIQIRMEVTIAHESPTGNIARFRVSDNGMGMTEMQMSRYLSGDLESSKELGNGLGGKFVRDNCLENGFQLNGQSTVGAGTSIWFDVPRLKS